MVIQVLTQSVLLWNQEKVAYSVLIVADTIFFQFYCWITPSSCPKCFQLSELSPALAQVGRGPGSPARSAPCAHHSLFHWQLKHSPNDSFCAAWQHRMCFRTVLMTNNCKNPPELHLTQIVMFYFITAVEPKWGVWAALSLGEGWVEVIGYHLRLDMILTPNLTWFWLLTKQTNCSLKYKHAALWNIPSSTMSTCTLGCFFPM